MLSMKYNCPVKRSDAVTHTAVEGMKSNKTHIHDKRSEPFVYSLLIKLGMYLLPSFYCYVIRSTSIT